MVVTKDFHLPEESELTVPEVNVRWPVLQGASVYIGKKCEHENNEFMLCRTETKDPRQCLEEGKCVTACAMKVFQGIKKHCQEDFNQYVRCLERSSGTMELSRCRKTQAVLDDCVLKNLNIERPPFGYFCEAKVHDTKRPKPKTVEPITRDVPDAPMDIKPEELKPGFESTYLHFPR